MVDQPLRAVEDGALRSRSAAARRWRARRRAAWRGRPRCRLRTGGQRSRQLAAPSHLAPPLRHRRSQHPRTLRRGLGKRADNQWRRTDEADRTPASSRALRDTGTALLNPPPQRNSAAPDASPLARLDGKQTRRAKPHGVVPPAVRSSARAASPVRLLDVTQGQRHDDET
jgi:hypothetical protein